MVTSREHVYLSSLLWDGLWIIQQPICQEIQRQEPVLFVERFVSIFTILRYPRLWRRLFSWLRGPRRLGKNLRVVAPLPLFHLGHRFPRLFELEFALQRRWLLLWVGASQRRRILWFDHPLFKCAVGKMDEDLAVYHVGDDVAEFRTSHKQTMNELEAEALLKADVVFAAADELARARRSTNPNTFAIQNAIDTSVFEAEVSSSEFGRIDRLSRPRATFIGVLDNWVDVDLLARTARELPEITVVIVGPINVDASHLKALPNVHFLGVWHRRFVPGILQRCSASLVPFKSNDLTARIVPAKVWEGLAAGIVPVCTGFSKNLDALERAGLVFVGRSEREYVDLVRRAVREDSEERREQIRAFGRLQTWSERWMTMSAIIDNRIEQLTGSGGSA